LLLNNRGQAAQRADDLPKLNAVEGREADAQTLLDSRELDLMIRRNYLALDGTWQDRLERYADLQQRSDLETVALFLAPLP
jgi:hypothetical protein